MESVPLMSVPTKPRHPVEIVHLEDMLDGGGEVEIEDESLAAKSRPTHRGAKSRGI